MAMLARPARGRARGDAARGPGVSPHVAIRRTRQGRGDNPGAGVPSAESDAIVSGADGQRGASAASSRAMAQADPIQGRGVRRSASLAERVRSSGRTPRPAAPLRIPGDRVLGAGRSDAN